MPRLGSFKNAALFALAISMSASVIEARQLECSYDYVTFKEVRTISEIDNDTGNLKFTFHHEFGSGGQDWWPHEDEPSLAQTREAQNYIRISENLYHWGRGIFKHILYVDFAMPKFYEIISFGPALRGLEQTSRKLDGNNRMLEIPVTVWDCKRLD